MPDGDCSLPGFSSLLIENQVHSLLRFACSTHDEPFVALQDVQPVLNVGGAVAEAGGGFKPDMAHQSCCPNFSDQFLLAVIVAAEEGRMRQPVQSGGMSGAVGQLMEGGADELFWDTRRTSPYCELTLQRF